VVVVVFVVPAIDSFQVGRSAHFFCLLAPPFFRSLVDVKMKEMLACKRT
jgi:hypothetical protein